MNIFVKVRKEDFEDGEYTPKAYIDKGDAIDFFETYNWTKDSEFTSECLIFSNEDKELFCIEKYSKDVYQLYVIDFSMRYYHHKTTKKTGVIKALNKFVHGAKIGEEDKFVREADRSFVNGFKEQAFIYKISFLRQLEASVFWVVYLIFFFGGSIFSLCLGNSFKITAIIMSLFIIFWLPGLIVHSNYWLHNRKFQIQISKGNSIFILTKDGFATSYSKDDIKDIIQYQSSQSRIPWTCYGFTRIVFNDKTSIVLTNLLIDQFELKYKKLLQIGTIKEAIFFPWLIKKNN